MALPFNKNKKKRKNSKIIMKKIAQNLQHKL